MNILISKLLTMTGGLLVVFDWYLTGTTIILLAIIPLFHQQRDAS